MVAIVARKPGVLAFQGVTGPAMVKTPHRSVPVNQGKIPAVVLRMTSRARLRCFLPSHQRRMESASLIQALLDIFMTLEAFEFRRSLGHVVTFDAMGRAGKEGMRL